MADRLIHDAAAVLSIGDELILGQTLDTNSAWLSGRLTELGVRVVEHATVDDDCEAIAAAIRRLAARSRLVIVTGGLGPTIDDLTRRALADALGEGLVEDGQMLSAIRLYFAARGTEMPENNRLQALRPESASALGNAQGTAPGLHARLEIEGASADCFCLPGPPSEMRPMFEEFVKPRLRPPVGGVIRTRVIHTFGLPEATIAERLGELMARLRNPVIGTTASGGTVSCRIRYAGPEERASAAIEEAERAVRAAVAPYDFGADDDTLAAATLNELRRVGERLVVAESCTGGGLGALLTEVPGSSDVFRGGWITYANEMKLGALGVEKRALEAHGAVSAEVACAMARGALRAAEAAGARAQHALAITGVAGPGGGSKEKPVGTVWIARATTRDGDDEIDARRFYFPGERSAVRRRSALSAMAMLRMALTGAGDSHLLGEQRSPD
ncbi:MAG: competence/damage-inducible protein A [Phycisphaeraceae bacterium]|nr:MAG: competence/damage-inducible protein A [Phycisphaeraceae bacterium]